MTYHICARFTKRKLLPISVNKNRVNKMSNQINDENCQKQLKLPIPKKFGNSTLTFRMLCSDTIFIISRNQPNVETAEQKKCYSKNCAKE